MKLKFIVRSGIKAVFLPDIEFDPIVLYEKFSKLDVGKTRVYDIFVAGENSPTYYRFFLVASWGYKFPYLALMSELGKLFGEPLFLRQNTALKLDLARGKWTTCRASRIKTHYLQKITRSSRSRLLRLHYMHKWPISTQKYSNVYCANSLEMCLSHQAWNIHFPPEYLLEAAPQNEETLKVCMALYVRVPSLRTVLFEYMLNYSFDALKSVVDDGLDDLHRIEAGLRDALQITLFKETPLFE